MPGLLLAALLVGRAVPPARAKEASWYADPETPACTATNYRVIEVTLPNILRRQLGMIRSAEGAEACRFLAERPNLPLILSFRDKDRAARAGRMYNPNPDAPMAYDRLKRSIMLEHRLLHLDGRDEDIFMRSPEAQKALVEAVGFAFVHEVSHARERERRRNLPPLVEDELLAFLRSFTFLVDALGQEKDFDHIDEALRLQRRAAALFAAYAASKDLPPGARETTRREILGLEGRYREVVSPVRYFAVKLLAALAESNARFESAVEAIYARTRPRLDGSAEEAARSTREKLDKLRGLMRRLQELGEAPQPDDEEMVRELEGDLAFWRDKEGILGEKRHYEALLAALRAGLDDRRRAGKLDAFKAPAEEVRYYYEPRFEAVASEGRPPSRTAR